MFVCASPEGHSSKRPAAYPDSLTEFIEYTEREQVKKHKNKAMSNITQTIPRRRKRKKWRAKMKYIKKFQNDEVKVNDDADH